MASPAKRGSAAATSIPMLFLALIITLAAGGVSAAEIGPAGGQAAQIPAAAGRQTVVVIPMEGMIDGGLYESMKRRIEESKAYNPALMVFQIDTYGGLVNFAMEITDAIGAVESPKTVAYVPVKAYSAGAMIAVSAREIVVGPLASIGDAAPIAETPEGPQMLGEKVQSPVRGIFRKYAERNNYPIALAESMVTKEIIVYEVKLDDGSTKYLSAEEIDALTAAQGTHITQKTVVKREGELLTMSALDAKKYGFARFIAADFDELLADYNLSGAQVVTLNVYWYESLARFLNSPLVSSILILIGILAVYAEFKAPGLGLPATIAIICFGTLILAKSITGMAQYWQVILFCAGLALLAVEIFVIPGFGFTGFLGITLMVGGLILMLIPPHLTNTPADVTYLAKSVGGFIAALALSLVGMAILARFLPKAPVLSGIYLGAPSPASIAHAEGAVATHARVSLVGKRGTAYTPLRPAGKAVIDENLVDVTTRGDMIPEGAPIEVVAEKGNAIIVKAVR